MKPNILLPLLKIKNRWREQGGYREVLRVAVPLIISTGTWAIQQFIDRMFLNWYFPDAIAASMPAGMLNFTLISLFIGTAAYVSTFIAQYYGSDQLEMVGPVLWQGLYVSLGATFILLFFIPLAPVIFNYIGHAASVQACEVSYFRILCAGTFPVVAGSAMAGLFTGLGKTDIVMWANIGSMIINTILNYFFIFGNGPFPELGIFGAGLSSVISAFFNVIVYSIALLRKTYRESFGIITGWRFNFSLFSRLLRFGLPSGIQFFLDVAGFTVFILIIGKLGRDSLAATNIAFTISNFSFMPMIGLGIATSVFVGQNLGRKNPERAHYSTCSAFHLTLFYMSLIAFAFLFFPEFFVKPFSFGARDHNFNTIAAVTIQLMRFIAFYSIFDAMSIIFSSALKGAGDTRFVMLVIIIFGLFILVIPTYFVINVLQLGIYYAWFIASFYIVVMGVVFLLRFQRGKWKSRSVRDD